MWSKPESLLAIILKSRYFQNTSFLSCGMGTRPSYAWQRLMHGRELLKQRLVTSIGPVTKTSVCSDNWILDTIPRPICNVKIGLLM